MENSRHLPISLTGVKHRNLDGQTHHSMGVSFCFPQGQANPATNNPNDQASPGCLLLVAVPIVPSNFLLLVKRPGATSSFLLLVERPGATSSFLLLVERPGATSSLLLLVALLVERPGAY